MRSSTPGGLICIERDKTMDRYNDDPQAQYGPQFQQTMIPAPKKRRIWPWMVVLVLFALCASGVLLALGKHDEVSVPSIGVTQPKATPGRSASPGMIQAGTWIVGSDVKAGKYQTLGASDAQMPLCYWDVRTKSETGEIVAQGVKDKASAKGYVTLAKGQYFTTSGCSDWTMVKEDPETITWATTTTPLSKRKVYVVVGSGLSGWPVVSASNWIDRYTGSDWVISKTCPANAYRCVRVVKDNGLRAPVIAATYGYNTSRVTIRVDVAYANSRHITSQAKRKNVLAHEMGHAGFLRAHSSRCSNLMYAHTNCLGWSLTSAQKATLRKH